MSTNGGRHLFFSVVVTSVGRILLVRDRLFGRVPWRSRFSTAQPGISRHTISSGKNRLDAVLVEPVGFPARGSVLICHGIGETVQHWIPVQQILADSGVASVVFDYSGYGRSSGLYSTTQSEQDAIAAFHFLDHRTTPLPVSILGFSLGSGTTTAILSQVPAHRLILCAAYTSLRNGAMRMGVPKAFVSVVPPVWAADELLRNCPIPVLILHGEKDWLFPVKMASYLRSFCGSTSALVIVPRLAHNEPFRHPKVSYWGHIVARFIMNGTTELPSTHEMPMQSHGAAPIKPNWEQENSAPWS
ncbi:MAG: alpha/beta fold hydrolase [Terracidiphilus sp.]|jgi:pimeloyl-ACP methyl ester carboxylesterase